MNWIRNYKRTLIKSKSNFFDADCYTLIIIIFQETKYDDCNLLKSST